MDSKKEGKRDHQLKLPVFTSHILFLDVSALALLLAPNGREDIALCNSMAKCLASLPWMKALQCDLTFQASTSSQSEHDDDSRDSLVMCYQEQNDVVLKRIWEQLTGNRLCLTSATYLHHRSADQEVKVDEPFAQILGILDFDSSRSDKSLYLATSIVSGQRDIFTIVRSLCSQDQAPPTELLVRAMSVSPDERIVCSVLRTCPKAFFKDEHLQALICSVCQMGYISSLKEIVEELSPDERKKVLQCSFKFETSRFELSHSAFNLVNADRIHPLNFACKGGSKGNIAIVKYLIEEHGMDFSYYCPFHFAAYYGSTALMKYLRENCPIVVDINRRTSFWERTPLMTATWQWRVEGVRCLLALGADPSVKCCGWWSERMINALEYALMIAERQKDTDALLAIVRLLYGSGCRVSEGIVFEDDLPAVFHPFIVEKESPERTAAYIRARRKEKA